MSAVLAVEPATARLPATETENHCEYLSLNHSYYTATSETWICEKIHEGIWRFGTTFRAAPLFVYLIDAGDGLLLFDTGRKNLAGYFWDNLEKLGRKPEDVHTIVISHSHHDHIGANAEIAERTGAKMFAHRLAETWMVDHQRQLREYYGKLGVTFPVAPEVQYAFFEDLGRPWIADFWLDKFPLVFASPRQMYLLHTPGHTADSISLFLPQERVLLAGDAFEGAGIGPNLPEYTDIEAYRESVQQIANLRPKWLFTSHFAPIPETQLDAMIQQTLRITGHLDEFLVGALQKSIGGLSLRFLGEMIAARFQRKLSTPLFVTILAHLEALASQRMAHFAEDGKWQFGASRQRRLPIANRD